MEESILKRSLPFVALAVLITGALFAPAVAQDNLTETYRTADGSFTMRYPASWFIATPESDRVVLSNNQALIAGLESGTEAQAGDIFVQINIFSDENSFDTEQYTAAETLENLFSQGDSGLPGSLETLEVQGGEVAYFTADNIFGQTEIQTIQLVAVFAADNRAGLIFGGAFGDDEQFLQQAETLLVSIVSSIELYEPGALTAANFTPIQADTVSRLQPLYTIATDPAGTGSTPSGHSEPVFNAEGTRFVTAFQFRGFEESTIIEMYDVFAGDLIWEFGEDANAADPRFVGETIGFTPNGQEVVVSIDGRPTVLFVDVQSGEYDVVNAEDAQVVAVERETGVAFVENPYDTFLLPDHAGLITYVREGTMDDGSVTRYRAEAPGMPETIAYVRPNATSVSLDPTGQYLVLTYDDSTVSILTIANGTERTVTLNTPASDAVVTQGGNLLLAVTDRLVAYDVASGSRIAEMPVSEDYLENIILSPDNRLVIVHDYAGFVVMGIPVQ